ncbi:MAG TPA: coniferyl aldehyde dehydrogenase, partial [Burkholderiales bacterium]|nr:coniferyl aldehyde dehydrogenase [Burkholderiales bacterium]
MNARTPAINRGLTELEDIFQSQRKAFRHAPNPTARERRDHLGALYRMLVENIDAIAAAIDADFGHRSSHETKLLELFPSIQAVRHARSKVAKWMRPERKPTSIW